MFTRITDWSGEEAKAIRYEIAGLKPTHQVKFRGAIHRGMRGTAMHLIPKGENGDYRGDVPF